MSDEASEQKGKSEEAAKTPGQQASEGRAFLENDRRETAFHYHPEGRAPWPVWAVWATFIIGFIAYMIYYALPDLTAWGRP